jgi:hypothetical protein
MKGVSIHLLIAFGGAWLAVLPLWRSGQELATSGATLIMVSVTLDRSMILSEA